MRPKTVFVVTLFLSALAGVGYIVSRAHHGQTRQGFTLQMSQTAYPIGRPSVIVETTVRYQKSDGSWRKETTYSNGRRDVGFGQVGRGVFHVNEKDRRLDYLSGMSERNVSEDELRGNPAFVGEETILGYQTFHLRSESQLTPGDYSDSYLCPALQGFPLRIVWSTAKGSKTVFEATKVILGEPSFTVPDYPIDTEQYEKVHGANAPSAGPAPN